MGATDFPGSFRRDVYELEELKEAISVYASRTLA